MRKLTRWTRAVVDDLIDHNLLGLGQSLDVLLSDVADLDDPPGLYQEVGDGSGG